MKKCPHRITTNGVFFWCQIYKKSYFRIDKIAFQDVTYNGSRLDFLLRSVTDTAVLELGLQITKYYARNVCHPIRSYTLILYFITDLG